MPIAARTTSTYEDKIARILQAIDKLSSFDKQLILNLILELSKRYLDKSKELEKFVRPEIEELDRRYIEQILKDFGYGI